MSNELVELAWAAGFFDGEGHARTQQYTFCLQIKQIDAEVLVRFRDAVGCGNVLGPYSNGQNTHHLVYNYTVYGLNAKSAYEKLKPYLSSIKINQAERALEKRRQLAPLK